LVVALAAIGPAAGSHGSKYDTVIGVGQRAGFGNPPAYSPTFFIAARSGPAGESAQGIMTIDWGTSWVDGPYFGAPYRTTVTVTNLCVTGNTATIVGYITSGTPNATIGDPLVTVVRDDGKGASDAMLGVFSGWGYFSDPIFTSNPRTLADVCHNPYPPEPTGGSLSFLPLVWGNISVNDASQ
jgi:hypothetical protein